MINRKSMLMSFGAMSLMSITIPIMLVPILLIAYGYYISASFVLLLYYALNSIALVSAFKNPRSDVQTKITWSFIELVLPGVGAYIFYVFARVPNRIRDLMKRSEKLENEIIPKDISNSHVEILDNGAEKFPKLFAAMENATEYINIQYFIMSPGLLMDKFFSVLNKKAEEGVKIRILYDYLGNPLWTYQQVEARRRKNIEIVEFNPIRWTRPNGAGNWRSHNKTVVIDGKEVFFGGNNIGDEYISLTSKYGDWIDAHYYAQGDIVHAYNMNFAIQWFLQTKKDISKEYPPVAHNISKEYKDIEMLMDSPDREVALTFERLKEEINKAKKSIKIITPYVAFPITFKDAIREATERGVDIQMLTIGKIDKGSAYYQATFDIDTLNDFGVKTYSMNNLFIHTKMFIFDEEKVIFGTTNLDYRAFFQHFETNVMIEGPQTKEWVDYFNKYKEYGVLRTQLRSEWDAPRSFMYFIVRLYKGIF